MSYIENQTKNIYNHYFQSLSDFDQSIPNKKAIHFKQVIKETSFVEPVHRRKKGSIYRILNDGDDPYRYVDAIVDHRIKEIRLTFIIKNEKQLDAFTNNCAHVNIRDAKYAESNKRIFVEWPAALYQDGFERIIRRIHLGYTHKFDMAYFIYWCSDINSYFAHELTTRSIKNNFGPRAYLWHRTGILQKKTT